MGTVVRCGTARRRGRSPTYHASHFSFLVNGCNDFPILVDFLRANFRHEIEIATASGVAQKHMPLRGCVTGESYRFITN